MFTKDEQYLDINFEHKMNIPASSENKTWQKHTCKMFTKSVQTSKMIYNSKRTREDN